MPEDYTVGQLISDLNKAHSGLDDSLSPINISRVEQIARLVRRMDEEEHADASSTADEIFSALGRAQGSVVEALEQRTRARKAIVEYRLEHFPGSDRGTGSGAGTGSRSRLGASSAAERRAGRKSGSGWVWGDLVFAGLGVAAMFTPAPAALAVGAGLVIAKLLYSGVKAKNTHKHRRDQKEAAWQASQSASVEMLWTVTGAIVDLTPGSELLGLAMKGIDGLLLLNELDDIRIQWRKRAT
ncbi:hypothetical protein [Microbacterium memoriense]|uniref:Uncharacterized protein n=1 Tax=Microbacterium memoriense TaxID=2978350 RepID=A0ABT2PDE4_9MICO|nr:hypothetical protein [Microbacterium memoriense]MCT9002607.1 hypothetical protein [Microbacterium memoriense]